MKTMKMTTLLTITLQTIISYVLAFSSYAKVSTAKSFIRANSFASKAFMPVVALLSFVILGSVSSLAYAADAVKIKKSEYSTALYLGVSKEDIAKIEKRDDSVLVYFTRNINPPIHKKFVDKYIAEVQSTDNILAIQAFENATMSVLEEKNNIIIIGSIKPVHTSGVSSFTIASNFQTDTEDVEARDIQSKLAQISGYIRNGKYDEAKASANEILNSNASKIYKAQAMYNLAKLEQTKGDKLGDIASYKRSSDYFDKLVEDYPDSYFAQSSLMEAATSARMSKDYFKATSLYRQIVDTTSEDKVRREASSLLADMYLELPNFDKAREAYGEYLTTYPDSADSQYGKLGYVLYHNGNHEQAYELYSQMPMSNDVLRKLDDKELIPMIMLATANNNISMLTKIVSYVNAEQPNNNDVKPYTIYASALIQEAKNNTVGKDSELLACFQKYPNEPICLNAGLLYAESHLQDKPYSYWAKFFTPIVTSADPDVVAEGNYLLMKSQYLSGMYNDVYENTLQYEKKYPLSDYLNQSAELRDDALFQLMQQTYKQGNYQQATQTVAKYQKEFPNGRHINELETIIDDINYSKFNDLVKSQKFAEAIDFVMDYLDKNSNNKNITERDIWKTGFEGTLYNYIKQYYDNKDYKNVFKPASLYFARLGVNATHFQDVHDMFKTASVAVLTDDLINNRNVEIVSYYNDNIKSIIAIKDQELYQIANTYSGLSQIILGNNEIAQNIYENTPEYDDKQYRAFGVMLGDRNSAFNLNEYDKVEARFVIGKVAQQDPRYGFDLLKGYEKDLQFAEEQRFGIYNNLTNQSLRNEFLTELYDTLQKNPKLRYAGSDIVLLDAGIKYFNENNFNGAVFPLETFLLNHPKADDNKAKGLYYLGKLYGALSDRNKAVGYYNRIVSEIPDSIYASLAKNEVDNNQWKQALNGNQ